MQFMITDLCELLIPDRCSARSSCSNVNPPIPEAPIFSTLRRVNPSHKRNLLPVISSIAVSRSRRRVAASHK